MFITFGFKEDDDEEEEFEEADAFPVVQTTPKGTHMNQRLNKIKVLAMNLEINKTSSMASKTNTCR